MLSKVFSLFFTFLSQRNDKTVPEPELVPNSKPELKPNPEPELVPNEEPEEEVDPIAMLAALPKASRRKDRFNPRLSPIREEESSEYMLSERNTECTRHNGRGKRLKKQIICMAAKPDYAYKPSNSQPEDKKLLFSVVCLFKPKCAGLSTPNQCRSTDIISSLRIFKAIRYRGRATRIRHSS